MSPSLLIERVSDRDRRRASEAAVGPLLSTVAPARRLCLVRNAVNSAAVTHGRSQPTICPEIVEGVRTAAAHHGLAVEDLDESALHAATLRLDVIGKTAHLPRTWVGQHLCVMTPLAFALDPATGPHRVRGPLALAFAQLQRRLFGLRNDHAPCDIAARIAGQAFATVTVVIDGTMATFDVGSQQLRFDARRCAATSRSIGDEGSWSDAIISIDHWLASRFGLGPSCRSSAVRPRTFGDGASAPWPRLSSKHPQRRRLQSLWERPHLPPRQT